MKAEAAMEARFLQIELESQTEEHVFLDSDDLRNLQMLEDHVKRSKVLILVQTKNVLTRPYCLLEVLTAIEHGIPIVGVQVSGRPQDAYDFAETKALLTHLDTQLEETNPGAADLLRDHGFADLTAAAHRLSSIIPKAISVPLNVCASRNMLSATIDDVVETMRMAVESRPACGFLSAEDDSRDGEMRKWIAGRGHPPSRALSKDAPRSNSPPGRDLKRSLSCPPSAGAGSVPYVAGRALFDCAKGSPALLPLAFLVQALANSTSCPRVAAAAEPLERAMLASPTIAADEALLREIADAIEAVVASMAAIAKEGGVADEESLVSGLRSCVDRLELGRTPKEREAAEALDAALSGKEVPEASTPLQDDSSFGDAAMMTQQKELLEMQNKVLLEQVAQMQRMMAEQQLSMQSFMSKFPQPPDEAERRIVLKKKSLMTGPRSDFAKVDDLVRNMLISGALGPHCRTVLFNLIGDDTQRTLAMSLSLEDGRIINLDDLPTAFTDAKEDSRRLSMCQYVVAKGEYVCFTKHGNEGDCFIHELFRKGVTMMEKEPAIQALIKTDPVFAQTLSEMSMMQPLMYNDKEVEGMSTGKRLMTKLQRGLMKSAVSSVSSTAAGAFMGFMLEIFSAEDMTYIGAPVMCEGHTMGSLCTMYTGGPPDGPGESKKEKLMRGAARLGAVLDAI